MKQKSNAGRKPKEKTVIWKIFVPISIDQQFKKPKKTNIVVELLRQKIEHDKENSK